MTDSTLTIDGMSCEHCVASVDEALHDVSGVQVRAVDIGTARIAYDPEQVDPKRIREAVEGRGFTVMKMEDAS